MSNRKYFAAGDYVTHKPDHASFDLLIETPFEKLGWKARSSSPLGTTFPGTAIRFEDRYYEVLLIQNSTPFHHYYLNPWEDRFPIRVQFPYTPQDCIREMKARRKERRFQQLRVLLLALSPLIGLLPAEMQLSIQNEYGISSIRSTFLSAMLTMIPGGLSVFFLLLSIFAGAYGGQGIQFRNIYFAGCYLFLESLARLYNAFKLEEPMGSLLVCLPVAITQEIFGRSPQPLQQKIRHVLNDKIRTVEAKDHDLEIISILPKPHWNAMTGIQFEGVWYGLVESQTFQEGSETRYKFLLKKAPDNFIFRTTSFYTRDEIQQLEKRRRRLELGTWVKTFAPFWGLLNKMDQERLEKLYEFDSLKFTLITIVALGALGFFNLLGSGLKVANGTAGQLDHLLLLVALYFFAESVFRWNFWRKGEPSGSALGMLVRPFAMRLM
jgi:hypothetical protein